MNWQDVLAGTWNPETATNEMIRQSIRAWRNRQLAASDWTQLPDVPVDATVWATYRQELRDMMQQNDDPKLIVFPEPPQ